MTTVPKKPLKLYLFRHGQTEWALAGKHTGRTDVPLTAEGEDEARAWAPFVQKIAFDQVFTSPRQRAQKTCALGGLGAKAHIEPDLAEWDYGDYEGIRSVEIKKERPDWEIFRDGCPHGESPEQITARADCLIARLSQMSGTVALFSHGHFGRVLSVRWIGLAVVQGEHFQLGTAALNILSYDPSHPDVSVIALWNATPGMFA